MRTLVRPSWPMIHRGNANTPLWTRTTNLRFRRPMLYPIELAALLPRFLTWQGLTAFGGDPGKSILASDGIPDRFRFQLPWKSAFRTGTPIMPRAREFLERQKTDGRFSVQVRRGSEGRVYLSTKDRTTAERIGKLRRRDELSTEEPRYPTDSPYARQTTD